MNLTSLRFTEEATLHKLSHFLPAQNPLKDFVHHNTLHAFQDKDFFAALQESSEIFGYKTFLPLNDFRVKLKNNEINSAILDKIINQKKGEKLTLISKGEENLIDNGKGEIFAKGEPKQPNTIITLKFKNI